MMYLIIIGSLLAVLVLTYVFRIKPPEPIYLAPKTFDYKLCGICKRGADTIINGDFKMHNAVVEISRGTKVNFVPIFVSEVNGIHCCENPECQKRAKLKAFL